MQPHVPGADSSLLAPAQASLSRAAFGRVFCPTSPLGTALRGSVRRHWQHQSRAPAALPITDAASFAGYLFLCISLFPPLLSLPSRLPAEWFQCFSAGWQRCHSPLSRACPSPGHSCAVRSQGQDTAREKSRLEKAKH